VHDAPEATLVFVGDPSEQPPMMHGLVVEGVLVLSNTTLVRPIPLHTFFLQLPGVCILTGVPAAVYRKPQRVPVQLRVWHSVSIPGQSPGLVQPAQWPSPSHVSVPPQELLAFTGGFEGTPFVQMS
jgi:hypothetical protein